MVEHITKYLDPHVLDLHSNVLGRQIQREILYSKIFKGRKGVKDSLKTDFYSDVQMPFVASEMFSYILYFTKQ